MNSINIITWNIKRNKTDNFYSLLNKMLDYYKIDIFVLQEASGIDLKYKIDDKYAEIPNINNGIKWVRLFYNKEISIGFGNVKIELNNKLFFVEFNIINHIFTFCGSHFYSKANRGNQSKMKKSQEYKNYEIPNLISKYEEDRKHTKTIVVGDFNYNPFDKFMNINIKAKQNKNIVKLLKKLNNSDNLFYNPMWNLLGDYNFIEEKRKPSGTYYLKEPNSEQFFWNLLDGVLLRPAMMDTLKMNTLQIICEFEGIKLTKNKLYKNNLFINEKYSDHLPIIFTLNLDKIK